jgi:hypothetical protein
MAWKRQSSAVVATGATPFKATVGATSSLVLAANTDRVGLTLTNDSDTDVYLGFGAAAVMNTGDRLNANGGSYSLPSNPIFQGVVYGIVTSGSKNVCGTEFTG